MNEMVVLARRSRTEPEDVEQITWRAQAARRMKEEYEKVLSEDFMERREERKRAQRKMIRGWSKALVIGMSVLTGLYLAKGDILSTCACIIIILLAITVIAQNGEY